MSLSNRRNVLGLLAACWVAGCDFTPVYQEGSASSALRDSVLVASATNTDSFVLAGRLEERLGRASNTRYRLNYQINTTAARTGIATNQTATRINISGTVSYTLTDASTGAIVAAGSVNNVTGYDNTSTTVATVTAETDARERLMIILADQIVTDLFAKVGT